MKNTLRVFVPVLFSILAFGASAPSAFAAPSLNVSSINTISDISVANGTPLEGAGLPTTVDVTLDVGNIPSSLAVTWNGGSPVYDGTTADTYVFTGTLTLPGDGSVTNSDNLTAHVNVIVGAPAGPNYTQIFGAIKSTLLGQSVTTNIDGCASTPTACPNLYFEKTDRGRVTFSASLDLTASSTNTFLENLGAKMEASAGSMKFDAQTAYLLKNSGAQIWMYGLNALGFTGVPNIVVKNDAGTVISPTDGTNYPALSSITFDASAHSGMLTFSSSHFTSFEAKKVINSTIGVGYDTIQAAIDAASTGDTINVAAGTYPEQVLISGKTNLTLQGEGDTTIIEPTYVVNTAGIMIKHSDGLTIKDLKIHTSGEEQQGIWVRGAFGDNDLAVTGLTISTTTIEVGASSGIVVDASTDVAHSGWLITGNHITSDSVAMSIQDLTDSTISDNELTVQTAGTNVLWTSERHDLANLVFSNNIVSGSGGVQVLFVTDYNAVSSNVPEENPSFPGKITGLTIHGNTFSHWDTRAIKIGDQNNSGEAGTVTGISITDNTFNDNHSISVNFGTATTIIGGLDAPSATGSGNIFNVSGAGKIQTSVDAAFAGDTINVAAGTYTGQLLIQKSLNLVGTDGKATTIVKAPASGRATFAGTTRWFNLDGSATGDAGWLSDYILAAYPTDWNGSTLTGTPISVKVSGFTFDANSQTYTAGAARFTGVFFGSVKGTDIADAGLFASEVKGFPVAMGAGTGVRILGDSKLTIDHNTVGYTANGIASYGDASTAADPVVAVSYNTVNDVASVTTNDEAIVLSSGATGTIDHNTIANGNSGIGIYGARNGIGSTVSNNTISNLTADVSAWGAGISLAENSTGNTITDNSVTNSVLGILVGDGSSNNTFTGNTITNNTNGVQVQAYEGGTGSTAPTGLVFHNNSFVGNTVKGVDNKETASVNATNNWWGAATGPLNATTNPSGLGNEVSDFVTFSPYYISDAKTTTNVDVAALAADKAALDDASIKGANANLANIIVTLTNPLPSTGSNGSTITWTSDSTPVVSNDGQTINRPDFASGDATVHLTATITKGAASDTKVFTLTVLKLDATQTAPDAETGAATVDSTTPEVVITNPDQAVTVDITAGTVDPTIDVSAFITDNGSETTGTLPAITITSDVADVAIPDNTVVTGPSGWDGVIQAPIEGTPSGGDAPAGFSVGGTVISVGSPDGILTFDTPVTIVLPGVTGTVGYRPSGSNTWTQITNTCGNTYDAPTAPTYPGECAINNGTDTKIVTYHFTSFGEMIPDPTPTPTPGHGGGNACGLGFVFNSATLGCDRGATPATPAVPANVTTPDGCALGNKFSTTTGRSCNAATPAIGQGQVLGASVYNFGQNLTIGSRGADVTALQQFLIDNGFSIPAGATGYFGGQTRAAVVSFQKAHGITPAVGFVGQLTRGVLNKGVTPTNLTSVQADAILSLLESFGAEASVVAKVRASLGR